MYKLELNNFYNPTNQTICWWQLFFGDKYREFKHKYPMPYFCYFSEINGRIYMHDAENIPIMDFSTTIEEMQRICSYGDKFFWEYQCFTVEKMPWASIQHRALQLIEKDRETELENQRKFHEEVKERNNDAKKLSAPQIPDILHSVKSASQWIEDSKLHIKSKPLYDCIWREKEICLLFADSNIGKSILATQIAFEIAKFRKVVYFDYELRAETFADRFGEFLSINSAIQNNFLRCQPNPDIFLCDNAANHILADINAIIKKYHAEVIIIDNISFINANLKNNGRASRLMYHLKKIAIDNCISMLVLAHSARRNPSNPITQNDLAGSKTLFNFADSAFTLGQSLIDQNTRYLKQLKARVSEISYGSDNVMLLRLVKSNGYLHFEKSGFDKESFLLTSCKKSDFVEYLKKSISQLEADGKSQRDIADILGISQSKVSRIKNL